MPENFTPARPANLFALQKDLFIFPTGEIFSLKAGICVCLMFSQLQNDIFEHGMDGRIAQDYFPLNLENSARVFGMRFGLCFSLLQQKMHPPSII